ncbi:MAG: hypothetical protein HC811_12910 [Flammeovirgaceae bacterium]|nr:hypothetical protein [Flammeovirgaceae bacterium]
MFDQNEGKPIPFKKSFSDKSTFVFANPQHDFPQTITYSFQSKDDLTVTISGIIESKYRESKFTFSKITE